jgi:uncharacterized damage-inducible protein DinB
MSEYALYLEPGPRRRKTMVHVLGLLGCIANGSTTDAALETTPTAIREFLRFLRRHGEEVDPEAAFTTSVDEHVTEGIWLGNGSPYVTYGPDLDPVTDADLDTFVRRFRWLREDLASWAATQSDADLDAQPAAGGRTGRAILVHILGVPGGYLSAALGGAGGYSRIVTAAERGQMPLSEALRQVEALATNRLLATTPEERSAVRQRPKGDTRTLRKAIRRMLEHDWEHLAELSRRPGGPVI